MRYRLSFQLTLFITFIAVPATTILAAKNPDNRQKPNRLVNRSLQYGFHDEHPKGFTAPNWNSPGKSLGSFGPNGAGKSTALKAVSGLLDAYNGRIVSGRIDYNGENINGLRTDQLVGKGIALVPEGRRIFPSMTVLENLEMGSYFKKNRSGLEDKLQTILNMFPRLNERLKQKAGTLSTGEQQMLALGRALIAQPRLLLADEPSLGLSPNFVDLIFDKLKEINELGTSVLLVEQNAQMALETAHRAYVFAVGHIELEGDTGELRKKPEIKRVFLGG